MLDKAENLKIKDDLKTVIATFIIGGENVVIEFESKDVKNVLGLDWINKFTC